MVLSHFLVYHIDSEEYLENHSLSRNMVFIARSDETHISRLESLFQAVRLWPRCKQLCWTHTWCLSFTVHSDPNHRPKFTCQICQTQRRRLYLIRPSPTQYCSGFGFKEWKRQRVRAIAPRDTCAQMHLNILLWFFSHETWWWGKPELPYLVYQLSFVELQADRQPLL